MFKQRNLEPRGNECIWLRVRACNKLDTGEEKRLRGAQKVI